MLNMLRIFATKTVGLAVLGAIEYILQNDPHNPMTWVNAVTGIFGVAAVRSAIDKSGPVVPPIK